MPPAHLSPCPNGKNPIPPASQARSIAMQQQHKCCNSRSEYFPNIGDLSHPAAFLPRVHFVLIKKDLHRNNLSGNAEGLASAKERKPDNPMELKDQLSTSTVAGAAVKKRTAQSFADSERKAWTVQRWAFVMGVSVPTTWDWIKAGKIPSVKCGGRRLIRISPDDYMDACAAEAAAKAAAAE
jgi:excisionase family DNA binding protein